MKMKYDDGCPRCDEALRPKAAIDSDHRVHLSWLNCESCGWDERHTVTSQMQAQGEIDG